MDGTHKQAKKQKRSNEATKEGKKNETKQLYMNEEGTT
jgi:hypothetical protein